MQQPSTLTTREKIQYGLIGLIVLGGTVIIGRRLILRSTSNNEEGKTFESGSAAAYAKQIKMAFENDGWWGTNNKALRETIRDITSKEEFVQVLNSYNRLYNQSMMRDMQSELKSTEYDEILAILAAKPEKTGGPTQPIGYTQYLSWAKRLNAAFNIYYGIFPGTDEDSIKAVFLEIPTQATYQQVAAVYRQTYGVDLKTELQSELELWEYAPMMQLITSKPQ